MSPSASAVRIRPGVMSMIRASPWVPVVITPACEPVKERASKPRSLMAMASRAALIRSPAVSSMSSSRGRGFGETSRARSINSSVVSPIAEITTTTSAPRAWVFTIRWATRLMLAALATDEPPNFWTTRKASLSLRFNLHYFARRRVAGAAPPPIGRTPNRFGSMTDPIRWGIAGPGRMAAAIVPEFAAASNAELVAVGSRSAERAEAFATEHDIPRWHSSYEALMADPAVQAIYIATPHRQHTDIALAAIAAGKAILVEKAFTASLADTERVVAAARAAGVFAMEAMWTRFNPAVQHIKHLVADGELGDVRGVQGDLTAFRELTPLIGSSTRLRVVVPCLIWAPTCSRSPSTFSVHPRWCMQSAGTIPTGSRASSRFCWATPRAVRQRWPELSPRSGQAG